MYKIDRETLELVKIGEDMGQGGLPALRGWADNSARARSALRLEQRGMLRIEVQRGDYLYATLTEAGRAVVA